MAIQDSRAGASTLSKTVHPKSHQSMEMGILLCSLWHHRGITCMEREREKRKRERESERECVFLYVDIQRQTGTHRQREEIYHISIYIYRCMYVSFVCLFANVNLNTRRHARKHEAPDKLRLPPWRSNAFKASSASTGRDSPARRESRTWHLE